MIVTLDTRPQLGGMAFSSTSSYLLQGSGTNFLTLSASSGTALVTVSSRLAHDRRPVDVGNRRQYRPGQRHAVDSFGRDRRRGWPLADRRRHADSLRHEQLHRRHDRQRRARSKALPRACKGASPTTPRWCSIRRPIARTLGRSAAGTVGKTGSAALTLTSIDVTSGPIAVSQGTLVLPSGLAAGGAIAVSSSAAIQAAGLVGAGRRRPRQRDRHRRPHHRQLEAGGPIQPGRLARRRRRPERRRQCGLPCSERHGDPGQPDEHRPRRQPDGLERCAARQPGFG